MIVTLLISLQTSGIFIAGKLHEKIIIITESEWKMNTMVIQIIMTHISEIMHTIMSLLCFDVFIINRFYP